mmetsp:Transcript_4972/g.18687  ORF Transcript_4972/g.18687 Transcript_4972/m.18687 type:complete len:4187 (-) Transcript_4972:2731-15291(-)
MPPSKLKSKTPALVPKSYDYNTVELDPMATSMASATGLPLKKKISTLNRKKKLKPVNGTSNAADGNGNAHPQISSTRTPAPLASLRSSSIPPLANHHSLADPIALLENEVADMIPSTHSRMSKKEPLGVSVHAKTPAMEWSKDLESILGHSQTIKYLKDVMIQDQNETPTINLLEKSSDILREVENMTAANQSIAPDDTQDIKKLHSGEDAVSFFSKAGKGTAVKFVYLNRAPVDDEREYRPYDLVVCDREDTNPEYFTMSASGVVHVQPGQPTEFMSLSDWMRESTMFNVLRKIRFFKYYLVFKCFKIWHKNSRFQKYCKKRAKLASKFFMGKETFASTLVDIKKNTHKLQSVSIMDFTEKKTQGDNTYNIEEFHVMQKKKRQEAAAEFDSHISNIQQKLIKLCKNVTSRARIDEMSHADNIDTFLRRGTDILPEDERRASSKKSKSMVQQQKDKIELKRALKKARLEADMLGNFIRLCDYMGTESLVFLAKQTLRKFYVSMVPYKSIVFKVTIDFAGANDIEYTPNKDTIMSMFQANKDEIVDSVSKLERLIHMGIFQLYLMDDSDRTRTKLNMETPPMEYMRIQGTLAKDIIFTSTQDAICLLLEKRFAQALEYGKNFENLKQWYAFGKKWNSSEYSKNQHTVRQFNEDLDKVKQALTDLKRMTLTEDIGILVVESRNLKKTLEPLMIDIQEEIKVKINETSRDMCKQLLIEFRDRVKSLKERPTKLREFALFVHNLIQVKEESKVLMNQADEVEKMYELASKNKVHISNTDLVHLEELKEEKDNFVLQIHDAETFREDNILSRTRELEENIQRINTELFNTMAVLRSGLFVSSEADTEDVLHSLNKLEENINSMRQRTEKFSEYKRLFNAKPQEWTNLREVEEQFQIRKNIWTTLAKFKKLTEEWKNTEIEKIDGDDIEKNVNEIFVTAHHLYKKSQDQVTEHLREKVKKWKDRLPVITMVGNKDLKQYHWQKIFKGMGVVLSVTSSYSLKHLSDLGIYEQQDLVTEISNQASGEAELQKMITQIDRAWKTMDFSVRPHRDRKDAFVLGSVEDIAQQLEDNLVTLQTMQASPYIAGVKSKVNQWEKKLKSLQGILEEWLTCQKKWMYLEFIFSSDDITRQLHEEAAKFAAVDDDFTSIMRKTNQNKNVISVVHDPTMLESFQSCNTILDEVQKNLEDFLGTKRESFPRFFFLSNDELIEILSQTREPRAVQPHLTKCFDSIKYLEFKDETSTEVVGMLSDGKEAEHVAFSEPIYATGSVEHWLRSIEEIMKSTLHDLLKTSLKTSGEIVRENWLMDHLPAQCIVTTDMINWTANVERALVDIETGASPEALVQYRNEMQLMIDELVRIVRRSDLSNNHRTLFNTLLVLHVHNLDVVNQLIDNHCSSVQDFAWQMHLRFYWDVDEDNCFIKQTNSVFKYGYEYIGNQSRLVITPLTERCYMTMTGALTMRLGGNPMGPAGTGKTETVKDLSKSLARQMVNFNCSEGLRVTMLRQMFAGLAQAGAWACFDEFNRIDVEVLSVVAQYMRVIQQALFRGDEHFIFDGRDMHLSQNYGVFVTMNPGYVGRTELPDNLKALFRPVSMMIPDYKLIAEIMLYAEGFASARVLAQKMTQLFKLSSEQLSKQHHYDFGMRAVKSILLRAGVLKRSDPSVSEDVVLIRAIIDSNTPKFLKGDSALFMALISDLFPGVRVDEESHDALEKSIILHMKQQQLQVIPAQIHKIIQLHKTMDIRHGVMLVGASGTGKTISYNALKSAVTRLGESGYDQERFHRVSTHVLNPKAVRMEELYGNVHELTKEWQDGLVAHLCRIAVKDKTNATHWMVFDGPVDSLWIENMNTVLDDNKMLCLTNGERIKLPGTIRLLFEVHDLSVSSPATVSRCGVVFFQSEDMDTYYSTLQSWIRALELPQEYKNRLEELLGAFVAKTLSFIRTETSECIPSSDLNLVQSLTHLIEILLQPNHGFDPQTGVYTPPAKRSSNDVDSLNELELAEKEVQKLEQAHSASSGNLEQPGETQESEEKDGEDGLSQDDKTIEIDLPRMLDMQFVFAFIWSLGANIMEDDKPKFDEFVRPLISDILPDFPKQDTVFDYCIDIASQQFVHWNQKVKKFEYKPDEPFWDILVPTAESTRTQFLLKNLIKNDRFVLVSGVSGVGKTILTRELLREEFKTDDEDGAYEAIFFNLSAQTTSRSITDVLNEKFDHKRKNVLGASGPDHRKIVFVDDANMPALDKYGSQPPLELLRQIVGGVGRRKGFYDLKKMFFKHVQDAIFIVACAPAGGGRHELSPRLVRHFHLLNIPSLSNEDMYMIYHAIIDGFFGNAEFGMDVQALSRNVVQSTLSMYRMVGTNLLPRPDTQHYTFNLRDVSSLLQGIMQISPKYLNQRQDLIDLWVHESSRVFRDRLTNDDDRQWFDKHLTRCVKSNFNDAEVTTINALYGDFVDDANREYQPLPRKISDLSKIFEDYLEDYKIEKNMSSLNLVFFDDAIQHLSRLCRILRQPRGNALLMGVAGSGRRTLTRLAAFIQGYSSIEIEVNKNFKYQQFSDNIKDILMTAGCEDKPVVFLLSDTQIVDERILEVIHNILNSGEVPNLFQVEDYELIIKAIKPKMKDVQTTRESIYRHFIHLIRENLHVVLCMSPVSERFRERIRMFPTLVNNMTIDWYDTWPRQALFSVAHHMYENISTLKDHLQAVCKLSVHISKTVEEHAVMFSEEFKRKTFTTPSNYLQLLNIYQNMLRDQKIHITQSVQRFKKGITKLQDTNEQVASMKVALKEKQPLLEQAVQETTEIEANLVEDKRKADEVRAICVKEERDCQGAMDQTQLIKDSCQADLDKAMPAFRSALKALKTINRDDIYEIKSFTSPPPLVQTVMEAVCILFLKKPNWESSQQLLADAKFLNKLETFDKENISDKTLKKLQQYMNMPEFEPERVSKVNIASKSLCMWVIAMDGFAKILKKIEPKRKKLAQAEEALTVAKGKLEEKRANLKEIEQNVEKLQHAYEDAIQRKKDLNTEIKQTEERLERAERLLDLLGSERVRWTESVEKLQVDYDNLIGDILLASASVAYLGPFNQKYRDILLSTWMRECVELKIPVGQDFTLLKIVDEVQVRDWTQKGLPTDDLSKQNAVLSQKCRSWPLFIDPQGEANNWIRNTERSNGLKIMKDGDSDIMRTLEAAVRVGIPCLLEDVSDKELDPALEPLLLKQTFKQGGRTLIHINDQDVDYNKNFKLYMTTKLSNPYYPPEIQIKVSLINFTVTLKGLEDQLLGDVVAHEKADLEKKKNALLTQISYGKNQLKDCEDKILELLFKETDVHLLDDIELINALKESKMMAETIQRSLVQAEKTADEINETRELYRPVATRASVLYFVISDLSMVDPMYQYSLSFFKSLFKRCLAQSAQDEMFDKRLENLINYTTETTYFTICRGLFQKDRLLFSFLMTVEILRNSNAISEDEWHFFLRGSQLQVESPVEWLSDAIYSQCVGISEEFSAFKDLPSNLATNMDQWKKILESDSPVDAPLPEPLETELSQWRKLLLLKILRPYHLIFAIKKLVRIYLGPKFVESPQFNLFEMLKDSNNKTPIIFVLSSGADPQSTFDKFVKERDYGNMIQSLSLGQGQGEKAQALIAQGTQTGEWIFLQNCHLAASWMPQLEKTVKAFQEEENIHADFRLFLTSMPSKDFPVAVLQNSLKLTNEPPKGLKENLKQSLNMFSVDLFERSNVHKGWKKLLFSLILFHGMLQERRKFGSLGWNVNYDWNSSDLEASLKSLELYSPSQRSTVNANIPWDALRYVISVIHYGGRVTDFLDLRCVQTIFSDLFSEESLGDKFHYGDESTIAYYPPARSASLEELKNYIDSLPENESPRIYGLNDNANITFFQKETNSLMDSVIQIQPAVVSSTSTSKKQAGADSVLTVIGEFEKQLPSPISIHNAHPDVFRRVQGGIVNSMGTFLQQEVSSFNKLLLRVQTTLEELKKAINGTVVMSDELEAMYNAFAYHQVPMLWANISYPSQLPLTDWFSDLCDRVAMIKDWIQNGEPKSNAYWLGAFFFPQGFLTSVMQNYSRKHKIPIDDICFNTRPLTEKSLTEKPEDGVIIEKLFMEGASWSTEKQQIVEAKKGELFAPMPLVHLLPVKKRALTLERHTSGYKPYECPLYRTPNRSGQLSTTGVSMNYIISLDLNPGEKKRPEHWIKTSVALLCEVKAL